MNAKQKVRGAYRTLRLLALKYKFRPFEKSLSKPGQVAFIADGSVTQGGLVDRLKGIISTYQYAKTNNKQFAIHFTNPYNLSEFLLPNLVYWLPSKPFVFHYPRHKPLYIVDSSDVQRLNRAIKKVSNSNRLDVWYNRDVLTVEQNHARLWHAYFWELFKISPALDKELKAFSIPENATAVHIRFLNKFGDYSSLYPSSNPLVLGVLDDVQKQQLVKKFEGAIETLLKIGNDKIVLFCDSNYFVKTMSTQLKAKLVVVPGEIRHSEDVVVNGFDAHKKTFIDFFLMSKCKNVVMLKSEETYNSSFSQYAAIIGNRMFNTIKV